MFTASELDRLVAASSHRRQQPDVMIRDAEALPDDRPTLVQQLRLPDDGDGEQP